MMKIRVMLLDKSEVQVFLDILLERAKWLESIGQAMWNIENLNPVNFEKIYPNRPETVLRGTSFSDCKVMENEHRQ